MACQQSCTEVDIENIAHSTRIPRPLYQIDDQELMQTIVLELINQNITTRKALTKFCHEQRRIHKIQFGHPNLLYTYRCMIVKKLIEENPAITKILRSHKGRSQSGVIVITVMTSPYPKSGEKIKTFSCPYDCHYCPAEPGQPRSYLLDEPAVARANRNKFDPILQFNDRATSYLVTGHPLDKIELLILGGTWSAYPEDYKEEFIRDIFWSANTYFDQEKRDKLSLKKEQLINETTRCRIIGLTIETRPDQIRPRELKKLRYYGVTRVQLGVQHTDNEILKKINRRCTTEQAVGAIQLLKNACFKVDIHLMPDLPGSDPIKDLEMFDKVLHSPYLQADQWKIYPCEITPYTKIKEWYEEGSYKPYAENVYEIEVNGKKKKTNELIELLIKVKSMVHPWIRLNRVIRDIPNNYILGGNDITNLRQVIQREMKASGLRCRCIRCREVKDKVTDLSQAKLVVREYNASEGMEYFISFENDDEILYGFIRLRLIDYSRPENHRLAYTFPELMGCALIRELHVYGQVTSVNSSREGENVPQHYGFGKRLLWKAEDMAYEKGYRKIAVISGVGVKEYYRSRGFTDEGDYLTKELDSDDTTVHPLYLIFIFFAAMFTCFGVQLMINWWKG